MFCLFNRLGCQLNREPYIGSCDQMSVAFASFVPRAASAMGPQERMLSVGLGSGAHATQALAKVGKVWPTEVRSNFRFRECAFLTTRSAVSKVYRCQCARYAERRVFKCFGIQVDWWCRSRAGAGKGSAATLSLSQKVCPYAHSPCKSLLCEMRSFCTVTHCCLWRLLTCRMRPRGSSTSARH